jgi:predicted transcriptional regulator
MTSIIQQLKTIRMALGMKQSEVGNKLGLPQSHISKIEQGATDPRISTTTDMARVMGQELMLIPRHLIPHVASMVRGGDNGERKWQPDEEVES